MPQHHPTAVARPPDHRGVGCRLTISRTTRIRLYHPRRVHWDWALNYEMIRLHVRRRALASCAPPSGC